MRTVTFEFKLYRLTFVFLPESMNRTLNITIYSIPDS